MRPSRELIAFCGFVVACAIGLQFMQAGQVSNRKTGLRMGDRNQALGRESEAAGRALVDANWGNLPLRFEKNDGQADARVDYVARGGSYSVLLSGTEAFFVLDGPPSAETPKRRNAVERMRGAQRRAAERVTVRMEVAGANRAAPAEPLERLETHSNYFIGNDPAQWHTGVVNYGKVRYRGVYPGVDLIYYGNQKELEYDFILAPGRDPGKIRLRFAGADRLDVNEAGDLVLRRNASELRQQKPRAYQWVGGEQRPVAARYQVDGEEVRFVVGSYDRDLPLTIDPSLTWSSFFGGSGDETIFGISLGPAGAVLVTGVSSSVNLPVTAGVIQGARNGALEDAFVAKLNPNGTALTFCTYLGGTNYDEGDAIRADAAGNIYVGGFTVSSNFPGTAGHAQPAYNGIATTGNGFIAKMNTTGTTLTFATYLGGGGPDGINDLALDGANNIYVTGFTLSGSAGSMPNFPTTAGVFQTAFGGTTGANTGDAFVTKLAANGNSFLYSTYLGGSRDDEGWGIVVDPSNNAIVAGETISTDFPTTAGTVQPARPAKLGDHRYSGWVAELNPTATALVFSTYFGGNGDDHIFGLARSVTTGNFYVTGATTSNNLPVTMGALQAAYGGGTAGGFGDAFVTALNPTATSYVYVTYLGGSGDDAGAQIRADGADFAYVAGFTSSANFPVSATATQTTLKGASNVFVAKIRPGGTLIIHASYLGGTGTDLGFGAAINFNPANAASLFFAGSTTGNGFPTTAGVVEPAFRGGALDGFVARYDLTSPTADFSPSSLSFPPQTVGTMSAAMPITYKNIGNKTMTINSIAASGDFSTTNTCPSPLPANLAAGASCTINVFFTPTALGTRNGTLTVTDTAPGSPHMIALTGTGM